MDKKTIDNLKNVFDDVESFNNFGKTDIGKSSRIFLIVGIIIAIVGYVSSGIILTNNVPKNISEDTAILLAMIVSISMLGTALIGLYVGQARYFYLIKNKK